MRASTRLLLFGCAARAPVAPTGLAAAGGTGQIVLTWTNPGGITSWDVEISSDGGSTWGSPINVLVATYTDASATSNVQASTGQVYYRIRANNAGGSSPFTDGTAHASPWVYETVFPQSNGTDLNAVSLEVGSNKWVESVGTFQSNGSGAARCATIGTFPGANSGVLTLDCQSFNYTLTCKLNFQSTASDMGILVRYADSSNWVLVWLQKSNSTFQIYETVAGVTTSRDSIAYTYSSLTADYTVSISMDGEIINASINGGSRGLVYNAITNSNGTGWQSSVIGFRAAAVNQLFKNFSLTYSYPITGSLGIGFIGESISAGTGADNPGATIARLRALRPAQNVYGCVQGHGGSTSALWASGSTYLVNAKAAFAAAGIRYVQIHLGPNDASVANAVSQATYLANMTSLVNDLVAAGYIVILHWATYITLPCISWDSNADPRLITYQTAQQTLINGTTILDGDHTNFTTFQDASLTIDNVHWSPVNTGSATGSNAWANADHAALASIGV